MEPATLAPPLVLGSERILAEKTNLALSGIVPTKVYAPEEPS